MSRSDEQVNRSVNIPVIVGIGASAGGLMALEGFFKNMPPDKDICFVVIQHLDPNHDSTLSEILQRSTSMPVKKIGKEETPMPNQVFVIPPGHNIYLEKDKLKISKQEKPRRIPLPIDFFFRSLADNNGRFSIGIVLSGTGSDGTMGIKEIKRANGMIMAQSPETAQHSGMPENVINTGLVDFILSPAEMPEKLLEYIDFLKSDSFSDKLFDKEESEENLSSIFRVLKKHTNHDFSQYKVSTVRRRIERRMAVNSLGDLQEYVNLLHENKGERTSLFRELLIGVTNFFRNKEAFSSLEKHAFPEIFTSNKKKIRVWIAGCATGEEAYTVAFVIDQYMRDNNLNAEIQFFATDIDEAALKVAREGKYALNIEADVPSEYLKEYFQKKDSWYQVKKEIREKIVFAEHSIIKDPPYSRLDLITCRNVLIYMKNDIQEKIINTFNYALNSNGILFLGSSESIGTNHKGFEPLIKKWKVFKKVSATQNYNNIWRLSGSEMREEVDKNIKKEKSKNSLRDFVEKTALSNFTPPLIVIDKSGEIQYSTGYLKDFFEFPAGEPSNNIVSVAHGKLKVHLANGLRKIQKNTDNEIKINNVRINMDGHDEIINIRIIPVNKPLAFSHLYMVLLETVMKTAVQEQSIDRATSEKPNEYVNELEQELLETRDYLQNVIEEMETSNEELKSANEEAQSSNEELQSTNEELETSKEELQSLNEELETSNTELERKVDELSKANNDINNFLTSTQIGTIFLDKDLKIKRFTPFVKEIIDLLDTDIGRSIKSFVTRLHYSDLIKDIKSVLQNLVPKEAEVKQAEDKFYWMRILPYRTIEDRIEGVVITFTNISEQKKMRAEVERQQVKYKLLFQNLNDGVVVQKVIFDDNMQAVDAVIIEANDAYTRHTGVNKEEIIGRKMSEVFPNFKRTLFRKLAAVVKHGNSFSSVEHIPQFNKYLDISAYKFDDDKYVAIFSDVTEIIHAQKEIKRNEEKFHSLFNNMILGICINNIVYDELNEQKDAIVTEVNPAFEQIFETERNSLPGQKLSKLLSFIQVEKYQSIIEAVEDKKPLELLTYHAERDLYLNLKIFTLNEKDFVIVVQDITRAVKESMAESHLSSLVESSEDAIYSVSPEGTVLTWNKGAESLYGFKEDEIVGKNVNILSLKDRKNEHEHLLQQVIKGKRILNLEIVQQKKDGSSFPAYLTKSPIYNSEHQIIAISDIVKDISLAKQREQRLIAAEKKAKESGALKTAFLQNVSHEIRTPMNSILGFSDILRQRIEGDNLKFLKAIENSGKQLLRLLDDIMDVSRIEAGELVIDKSNLNLHQLLRKTREQFEVIKTAKRKADLELNLILDENEDDLIIYTDKYRLQQILSNLLSNAIKYTEAGKIEFGYELKGDELQFFVLDTGHGIEKKYHELIFERFNRSEHKTEKIFSGTGLGLTISKALTEMLGGRIWCESEPAKGSQFYFTIPYVFVSTDEEKHEDALHHKDNPPPDLKGKRILIVEDDEYSMEMMKLLLDITGADILEAVDGEEAVKLIHQNNLDLVLLDIRLPKKDGFEVMHEIKQKDKSLPVIAQTAFALPEERKKTLESGFVAHIDKPVKQQVLYQILNQFLKK